MALKHHSVELVHHGIVRGVEVHGHLLQNHPPLFLDLPGRKHGVEGDVGEQVKSLIEVLVKHGGVEADFFFGGVGVQLPPQRLQPVDDVKRFALSGAFEGHVLPKVRQPLLVLLLIAAADVEHEAAVGNLGGAYLLVEYPNAVGQGMKMIIRH